MRSAQVGRQHDLTFEVSLPTSDLEVEMPLHTQSPTHPRFARRDAASSAFRCARSPGGLGPATVHLSGELDLATAPQLEQALREAQLDASLVVLDLRELEFMDCAGLHIIVDAAVRARRDGRRLIVLRGPAQVDKLFRLIGTADIVEISDHDPRQPATDQGLEWVAAVNGAALS